MSKRYQVSDARKGRWTDVSREEIEDYVSKAGPGATTNLMEKLESGEVVRFGHVIEFRMVRIERAWSVNQHIPAHGFEPVGREEIDDLEYDFAVRTTGRGETLLPDPGQDGWCYRELS